MTTAQLVPVAMSKTNVTFLVLLILIAANWIYDLLELSVERAQEEERDDE